MSGLGLSEPIIGPRDVVDFCDHAGLDLDQAGAPTTPLVWVDLSRPRPANDAELKAAAAAIARSRLVTVGLAADGVGASNRFCEALDCTLVRGEETATTGVSVSDVTVAAQQLSASVHHSPRAALTLVSLLRATEGLPTANGLVAESLAYSMLLAGPEFKRWRSGRPARPVAKPRVPAVSIARLEGHLEVRINRPERRNAFSVHVRDALIEAFDLALLDTSVTQVHLSADGPAFCSGGDLDEFGSSEDVTTAHLIRLDRSVAERLALCRERVTVSLHGACIGAGIEIAAFAQQIRATEDTFCQLPELSMGLLPGAGGTVSIPRRIGRWRTAFLALTGKRIDADTAARWGLVDVVDRG